MPRRRRAICRSSPSTSSRARAPPRARPPHPSHIPARRPVSGRRRAPLVLGRDPAWVVQHRLYLPPHRLLQLIASHGAVAARRLATELVRIRPRAPVVAVVSRPAVPDHAARHLAVERITALPAHHEALQKPSGPASPLPLAPAVLIELCLYRLEYARVDDRRHRDRDPLLWRHWCR